MINYFFFRIYTKQKQKSWVRIKPLVALAGILCPLLAIVTSFGLLLWVGELYNAIVNVSPFLVLCIGIDDLFIMSAEWHRTNPEHSAAERVAHTLSEAAVAITITSITDIMTFGIGTFTSLPGVRMFCLYTSIQVVFTYIYQELKETTCKTDENDEEVQKTVEYMIDKLSTEK